jgi:hypothetical protein
MGRRDSSDPVRAWRERLARYAREEMELGDEDQQTEAIVRLGLLEGLDRRRRVLRLLLTLGYIALTALLVLLFLCAAAIVWIVLKTDSPAGCAHRHRLGLQRDRLETAQARGRAARCDGEGESVR